MAYENNYNWILTMDQDTSFKPNVIETMKKVIENENTSNIGIITPWHNTKLKIEKPKEEIDYPLEVMTSGNLVNIEIHKKIDGYKDWFFIDGIDIEYGLNLAKHNYKIMRLNNIEIDHNLGDIKYKNLLWEKDILCTNHNYLRRYYMMRNYLYIKDMYKDINEAKIRKKKKKDFALNIFIFILYKSCVC